MGCLKLTYYDEGLRLRPAGPDPLAEKYSSYSPYNYVLNNPVRYIDPDGREPVYFDCLDEALAHMHYVGNTDDVEIAAYILADGRVMVLPSEGLLPCGTPYQNTDVTAYMPITRTSYGLYYRDRNAPGGGYEIAGIIHLHLDRYSPNPSMDDYRMEQRYPDIEHFILWRDHIYDYQGDAFYYYAEQH